MQMQIIFFAVHLLPFNFILIPLNLPCTPTWYLLAGAFKMSWLIDWLMSESEAYWGVDAQKYDWIMKEI